MRGQTIAQASVAVLFSLVLAACGGGGPNISLLPVGSSSSSSSSSGSSSSSSSSGSGSSSGSSSGSTSNATSITLVSSSSQLQSSALTQANGVVISAIVKDSANNLLQGVNVSFSTSAAAIAPTQPVTDNTGTALAVVTTGGDRTNQTISVTASASGAAGTVSSSVAVFEVGTKLGVSGASVVGLGSNQSFTITLQDSANSPIANASVSLSSSNGNAISVPSATTNANGQATFTVTGTKSGADTLIASGLGANVSVPISVSVNELTFSSPANGVVIKFNASQTIKVLYQNSSAQPSPGQIISFKTDRGTLSSGSTSGKTVSATTGADGTAIVTFLSDGTEGAGGVNVTATAPDGTAVQLALSLVAITPAVISIQANPVTLATSATSTITALVLDAKNNPVPGVNVDFVLSADSSGGGKLSAGTATTNNQGQAIIFYQAGPGSSGTNGVQVNANVDSASSITTAPANPAKLTVASNPLFIKIGTGVLIQDYPAGSTTPTEYQQPFSVIVSDSAGNPAPSNTVVQFQLVSTSFQTGVWGVLTGASSYSTFYNVKTDGSDANAPKGTFGCVTEDTNHDGILDAGDDNYMSNKASTAVYPGDVATVTPSVTLDSTGSGQFLVTYPKDYAEWVEVNLLATTTVAGTQYSASRVYVLPVAAKDVNNTSVAPPGVNFGGSKGYGSPFGLWSTCANVANSGFPGS